MRFLADMCVSLEVVEWLRQQQHDTKHLREENLHRLPNGDIFKKAAAENRILLTFDLDFGEIVALAKGNQTGVILFRLYDTRPVHVIERLKVLLADAPPALNNSIITVEETRYRIRHFPT